MTDRDAFKLGFLGRCVEAGLSGPEIAARVEAAREKVAGFGAMLGAEGWGAAKSLGKGTAKALSGLVLGYGGPLLLAGPPLAGAAAGFGLAKATDIDDTDLDDIKDQELVDEYRRQAEKLRQQRAVRDFRRLRGGPSRPFA